MTLTEQNFASSFSSPAAGVGAEEPSRPVDDSAEGMRRLRDPFAVDTAARQPAMTDDEPKGR